MKSKTLTVLGATVAACLVVLGAAFILVDARAPNAGRVSMAGAVKILPAAHAYAQALKQQARPVPAFVDAKELVAKGLLRPVDITNFAGMEVAVATAPADGTTNALMRVRQPDGTVLELLGDGSVQFRPR
jgi:membrane-bound ClpP family serine protease